MKKTMFSLLMLAAMFMIASCGSKSNSGEATANSEENETEAVTPTYEPTISKESAPKSSINEASNFTASAFAPNCSTIIPFTFSKMEYFFGKKMEDVSLKGVFEISKISLAKVTGKIYYSAQLSGEGDCLTYNIHLKMIADFPQKPDGVKGTIQFLNKDDAMLYETSLPSNDLANAEKGDVVILSNTTNEELDVEDILANTKYVRITEFCAGKRIE